jgi:hypothetical protein
MDQQGMYLPNNSYTFAEASSKQVDVMTKDEKQVFTVAVSSPPNSSFLPFHCVWAGRTSHSLPKSTAPGMNEALKHRFNFAADLGTSHFSTLKTTKEYITAIIEPYWLSVIQDDPSLADDQKLVEADS